MEGTPRILLILKPSPAREALAKSLTESGWTVDATSSTFRGVSGLAREPRQAVVLGLDDVMDEELETLPTARPLASRTIAEAAQNKELTELPRQAVNSL